MKVVYNMLGYFITNKMNKTDFKDNSVILSRGKYKGYCNLVNYTSWLMTMINYSREVNIELNKLIDLITLGYMKGLNWENEADYIQIYKNALHENNILTVLTKNAEILDE